MKTKLEIVENLCNSGKINFREALILLEKEKKVYELVDKEVAPNGNIDVVTPSSWTVSSSTAYYCRFTPSVIDAHICAICGKTKVFHIVK